MREDDIRSNKYKQARSAIKRIAEGRNFNDWMTIGEALVEARIEAREEAGLADSNLPWTRLGSGYNRAFSTILKREKLDSTVIDSATRNNLFSIMEHRVEIEERRKMLAVKDPVKRSKLNHPSAVLNDWKQSSKAVDERDAKRAVKKPGLSDSVATLSEENAALIAEVKRLKAHVEELVAARVEPAPAKRARKSKVDAIDRALTAVQALNDEEYKEFIAALKMDAALDA